MNILYDLNVLEDLKKEYNIINIFHVNTPILEIDSVNYQMQTYANIIDLFKKGGDIYLMIGSLNKGFNIKKENPLEKYWKEKDEDQKKAFQAKLKIVREFQIKYPNSHVCGSIGLFLHGIELKRDWIIADIDMISPTGIDNINFGSKSVFHDFDQMTTISHLDSEFFSVIEVKINPDSKYVTLEYQGEKYNVSQLDEILSWKEKYANKGSIKHQDDLHKINPNKWNYTEEIDDLSF